MASRCLGNLFIILAAVILLTYVSAWYSRKVVKNSIQSLTIGWLIILGTGFCCWMLISRFIR